jgi:glycosyltransferase involved in cell wall biosynthesis
MQPDKTGDRMRILYLSLEFPIPVNNGHRMRIWSVLEALAAECHEVTFVSFAEDEEVQADLKPLRRICQRVELVPHTVKRLGASSDYAGRLRALLSSQAYSTQRFISRSMRARIELCLREQNPDLIICDTVFAAGNMPQTKVPLFINNPDVESLIVQRYSRSARNPLVRIYAAIEAKRVMAWEQHVCNSALVCMACSEQDRKILSDLAPATSVVIVPNVVDTQSYAANFESESHSLLFQGGMDWLPNRDGVEFFVTQVFPLIRRDVPDAEFIAAGRNPSPEMVARFSQVAGVKFTGTVPDMRPYLEQAGICVVPLRLGSGTRLKILESAAAGKAIVSTRLGAEGLDFVNREEIWLADDPDSFALAVKTLLRDPIKRRAMGEAACRRVRELYSYERLRTSLRQALNLLKAKPSGTATGSGTAALPEGVFAREETAPK